LLPSIPADRRQAKNPASFFNVLGSFSGNITPAIGTSDAWWPHAAPAASARRLANDYSHLSRFRIAVCPVPDAGGVNVF
jgi:hypothetical protein